nr:hypothetical protein [Tanacetum cinerariifolium]
MIVDLDADEGVALVNETQRRNDQDIVDKSILDDEEVVAKKEVSTADPVTTAGEVVTTADEVVTTANYELAVRLQEEERGELTIEEKSRLFVELMDKRKKYFARLKVEKIRSKPPTKTQKRNPMFTYLKNMANYNHSQLKNKSFEEISMLFNNTMKWINSFVPMDTELVKDSKKAAKGSFKRAGGKLEQEDAKRQRIKEENESTELKRCLKIIPDGDDVTIEDTPLSSKSPSIMDYKIYKEGRKSFFKIIRADGNSKNYLTFGKMLRTLTEKTWKFCGVLSKQYFRRQSQ